MNTYNSTETYAYDTVGNLSNVTSSINGDVVSFSHTYDNLNQLIQTTSSTTSMHLSN